MCSDVDFVTIPYCHIPRSWTKMDTYSYKTSLNKLMEITLNTNIQVKYSALVQ